MFKLLQAHKLFLLLSLFVSTLSHAGHFENALKAYAQKDWSKAENLFRQHIISNQQDAHAYFNIGSCLFQQEKYTDAIWNFEKAFKLDPSLTDVQVLLDKSYQKAALGENWTPPVSYFQLKLFQFSSASWSLILLILSVLTGILLFSYFVSGRKKLLLGLVIFSTALWLFCCFVFYSRESFANTVTHAIVVQPVDMVYVSADGNALQDRNLKKGERLEVMEVKDRIGVSAGNGPIFWLDKEKLRLIE
ncbi:MAG: tetratricopeptide repeat protein [Bacteroidota bacterium]